MPDIKRSAAVRKAAERVKKERPSTPPRETQNPAYFKFRRSRVAGTNDNWE